MASLTTLFGKNIKSYQTGTLADLTSITAGASSGEDQSYYDITVSAVNTSKSIVIVSFGSAAWHTARLTSSTNLRFGASIASYGWNHYRYEIIEFY